MALLPSPRSTYLPTTSKGCRTGCAMEACSVAGHRYTTGDAPKQRRGAGRHSVSGGLQPFCTGRAGRLRIPEHHARSFGARPRPASARALAPRPPQPSPGRNRAEICFQRSRYRQRVPGCSPGATSFRERQLCRLGLPVEQGVGIRAHPPAGGSRHSRSFHHTYEFHPRLTRAAAPPPGSAPEAESEAMGFSQPTLIPRARSSSAVTSICAALPTASPNSRAGSH
jgi:hypothetical protein